MRKSSYKLPSDLVSDIKTRLKTLSGQLKGIVKMLDEGKDPEHINIQFKSVDSCPGNCGSEDKIDYLKNEFSNIALGDLTEKLKEIHVIEQRLKDYNEKNL